jgi:hypothetical protein
VTTDARQLLNYSDTGNKRINCTGTDRTAEQHKKEKKKTQP